MNARDTAGKAEVPAASTPSRAAVAFEPGAPLEVVTIDVCAPGEHEVLVRFEAAGICHTDLNFASGAFPHAFPAVFGHEGVARVVSCGDSVTAFAAGDRVMPFVIPHCGKCTYCASGRTNFCSEFQRTFRDPELTAFSHAGRSVADFFGVGAFSEYSVIRDDQIAKVSDVPPAVPTCCIGCGVTTGLGSALITAGVRRGDSVAVFGAGGVGAAAIQGAALAGASRIIAVDLNPAKEEISRKFGATDFIDASVDDAVERIIELTGAGADHAFECVGSVALTKQAFASVSIGWGQVVSVGMIPEDAPLGISLNTLRNRTWRRSMMGSATVHDAARYVDWFVDGKISLDDVVSHTIRLEDINEGIDLMHHGKAARVAIDFSLS
ncbi:alcohol dehydrogenase catalytic domain-containing protein [Mycobacterium sp. MBM]|nr:alcohol dehydrogenase catalytic domain-containing protein [Mycobacterium sp. MBM]